MAMFVEFTSNVTDQSILDQITLKAGADRDMGFNTPTLMDPAGFADGPFDPGMGSEVITLNPEIVILSVTASPDDDNFIYDDYFFGGYTGFATYGASQPAYLEKNYTIHVEIEAETSPTLSPYNQVFIVDAAKIVEFGNVNVIIPVGSGEAPESINNTDYVINLLRIPFEIPSEFIGADTDIFLGGLNTNITAPKLESEKITVSVGDVTVGDLYGNSLDYVAVDYEVVLPHVAEVVEIEPQYVVGNTLSFEYVIDAYSGDSTVNIYNGDDLPFKSVPVNLGRVVPFKTGGSGGESTSVGDSSGLDNGVTRAYVRALRRDMLNGDYSNLSTQYGLLSDFSGYVEVENIEISVSCTSYEKSQILSLLSDGVIIK